MQLLPSFTLQKHCWVGALGKRSFSVTIYKNSWTQLHRVKIDAEMKLQFCVLLGEGQHAMLMLHQKGFWATLAFVPFTLPFILWQIHNTSGHHNYNWHTEISSWQNKDSFFVSFFMPSLFNTKNITQEDSSWNMKSKDDDAQRTLCNSSQSTNVIYEFLMFPCEETILFIYFEPLIL